MTVTIDKEVEIPFSFDADEVIHDVVSAALNEENFPYEAEISVVLTNDKEIRAINKEMRSMDKATDVLSFPMMDFPSPGDFSHIEEDEDNINPETGEVLLGDIMISVDKVISQAEAYGHSDKRELAFLVAHSMLHLMGYDHEDCDRTIMEEKQEKILSDLGIGR